MNRFGSLKYQIHLFLLFRPLLFLWVLWMPVVVDRNHFRKLSVCKFSKNSYFICETSKCNNGNLRFLTDLYKNSAHNGSH